MNIRVGIGYDVHKFASGRALVLGGVNIDHPQGLLGHSDADVLVHAIIDSLMGPADLGDIGTNFPDTDPSHKDADSIELLRITAGKLMEKGISIINIDAVIACQKPKIAPYIPAMKRRISQALGSLSEDRISIKGKTTEGLGFTGREEGIASYAVSLISLMN